MIKLKTLAEAQATLDEVTARRAGALAFMQGCTSAARDKALTAYVNAETALYVAVQDYEEALLR